MPHTSQHRPTKLTLQDILDAKRADTITTRQFTDMFGVLQDRGEGATLSSEEAAIIMGGGQIDDRGFLERTFGGIGTEDPQGTFTRSSFGIPLPFTDEEVGVNAPLGLLGLTALSLGATAPAGGALAAARTAPLIGGRSLIPGLGGVRGVTAASRFGGATGATARTLGVPAATAIGGGLIGSANQPPILPDGAPTAPAQDAPGGAALGAEIAGLGGGPILPGGGTSGEPVPPISRNPVPGPDGEPIPGQFFYTDANGLIVDPNAVSVDPEVRNANANFLGTREGQEFLAEQREIATGEAFGRQQQLAAFERQRTESIRQGNFEEARNIAERQRGFLATESKAQRDASFVNALLPILASPGSRFRFAANVSRLGGGGAQFTPTEAFGRLFRFSGLEPGSAVPLTGEQNFSIIPNIQQFADLGPRAREELSAIVGESSGQELRTIERASRRGFR